MDAGLLYLVALTTVPGIGDVHTKALLEVFYEAEEVFSAGKKQLAAIVGLAKAASIKEFNAFDLCVKELEFMTAHNIRGISYRDPAYPQRLLSCYDCPPVLYYRGTADLNASRIVSVVGTRSNSDYGRQCCQKLVQDLRKEQAMIVSGLAFGIDTIAHRAAVQDELPTIGVLAHGLDILYPLQNRSLSKQMEERGGLLTDFRSGTRPDRQNFPKRNRIVAGICDALVVVESSRKGGSLITAELANSYNKDVFAFPGRTTDLRSEGCNYLISQNKASLITSAADLLDFMNWKPRKISDKGGQRSLFIELSENERCVYDLLYNHEAVHVDQIYFKTGLSSSAVAAALLSLEMQGIVAVLPGKQYKLVG